jgi:hypothetical protein
MGNKVIFPQNGNRDLKCGKRKKRKKEKSLENLISESFKTREVFR